MQWCNLLFDAIAKRANYHRCIRHHFPTWTHFLTTWLKGKGQMLEKGTKKLRATPGAELYVLR